MDSRVTLIGEAALKGSGCSRDEALCLIDPAIPLDE